MKSLKWLVWVLVSTVVCAEPPAPTVTVADSAGVRITVSSDTSLVFGSLDSAPSLSIGGADASGPEQFFRIQGLHVDVASRIWVADGQSGQIRIFDRDGQLWKVLGGRGEGPGEFLQVRLLGSMRGDSVVAGDSGSDRVTIFSPEGKFVRTQRLPSAGGPAARPFAVFEDGTILGQVPRIVLAASLEPGQVLRDSVEVVRVDSKSGTAEPMGAAPGPLWLWTGRNQVPIPFTVSASFDLAGDGVQLVFGPDFRVREFRGGELSQTFGVLRRSREVAATDVDAHRAFISEFVPEPLRPDYTSALEGELRPSLLPGYDRVLVSADGYVWAQVYDSDVGAPHDWHVYDTEREFAGRVRVGAGFYPMVITTDAVLGVWRDSMGVELVRAYRVRRGG